MLPSPSMVQRVSKRLRALCHQGLLVSFAFAAFPVVVGPAGALERGKGGEAQVGVVWGCLGVADLAVDFPGRVAREDGDLDRRGWNP